MSSSPVLLWTLFFAWVGSIASVEAGIPAPPQFYHHQLVDHFDSPEYADLEYAQRYYVYSEAWSGPGSPILLVLGGEGAIEPHQGLLYPFVNQLAQTWGGFVLQPEHRFYGVSQPLSNHTASRQSRGDQVDPRVNLLTVEQALKDAMRLLHHVQDLLQCSRDKFSDSYCPVITIGGSYPGFLSAMARLRFSNSVDMAYAASAPMKFYSQKVETGAYYEHITHVADHSLDGCADGTRTTLSALAKLFSTLTPELIDNVATWLGFCPRSVPEYIKTGGDFRDEVMMMVGYTFANDNMGNYPPDNRTRLHRACEIFTHTTLDPIKKAKEFFQFHLPLTNNSCVDMRSQLPSGNNATISGGDWSGDGTGNDGDSWDFQTCSWLIEAIGFSKASMFPVREWSLEWLNQHCASRFPGVKPRPYALVKEWRFDDLASQNATRILFTNGLNDGWSVGGITSNLSESLIAINFENGAHHSDLSGKGPSEDDTDDIRAGYASIQQIFANWLKEVQPSWSEVM